MSILLEKKISVNNILTVNTICAKAIEDEIRAKILQLLKLPDGTIKVLVEGIKRVKIIDFKDNEKFITCDYTHYNDVSPKDEDLFPLAATALRRLEKLTSINKKQDALDNEIEILEADQTTATVTIDALSLSINDRMQEIDKIQKIYFFELETANKVIASANSRLPDFRRKLPTNVSGTESLADRFNNLSHQEKDERIAYANINESIDRVNEMTPKLVLIKEFVAELIELDSELLSLEKEQIYLQT